MELVGKWRTLEWPREISMLRPAPAWTAGRNTW